MVWKAIAKSTTLEKKKKNVICFACQNMQAYRKMEKLKFCLDSGRSIINSFFEKKKELKKENDGSRDVFQD